MRDALNEALNDQMERMNAYERMVPICDECGQRLTAEEWYWDVNTTILCERCLMKYRRSIEDYRGGDG